MTDVSRNLIHDLPKAEVHVHLEGCLEPGEVEQLAREAGEPLPRPVERLFDMTGLDLAAFLDILDWTCSLVRTPEQLARIAYAFATRQAAAGVVYSDLIFNPTHWTAWRGRLAQFIDAVDAGLRDAESDGLPPVGVCVSLLRQQSASEALELVDWLLERGHPRVVALSIDGNEAAAGQTGPRFAEAFSRAAGRGLHRTVHAGESSGPDGVWDALRYLRAERIDHGVRSIEDADLVQELAQRRVTLNICPSSNVDLGLYPDLASHPIERLRRAGVPVTINTDDPALMGTDLISEYLAVATTFGWDDGTLRAVAQNSLDASFCDPALRRAIVAA
ncbi:MAG: adenosine deaminase [Chloroflexota bacterium]